MTDASNPDRVDALSAELAEALVPDEERDERVPGPPQGDVFRVDGQIVRVEFSVPGRPKTWQRARRGQGHGSYYTPKDRENKMSEIRDAWRSLLIPPFSSATSLRLGVVAVCKRPGTHYRTNGALKEWALNERPRGGKNGGDLDNFVKLVKDALNEVAYPDDTQIVGYLDPTEKRYVWQDELPHTEVVIAPLEPVDVSEVAGQEVLLA